LNLYWDKKSIVGSVCDGVHCRVGQILNLYWEKTPESVLYVSVRQAIDELDSVELRDYTATEDVFVGSFRGCVL